ncbi:putrescine hydroxycinnamoyltransferase 1-like [Iris pallida]|uniref:Putrescine hydroxycinnamoyltransferase 1-like n=1 Tax=Iris pallida TaxID=29817 RepID=A0AAX6EGY3_IRIPA|nr:putrescine hydroxycinnamoyltransferase 1-like [Iris pallida]
MVEVVESSLVAPNGETPKHTIWLSNLDFNIANYHMPVVYVYRYCNGDQSAVAGALKAALADALVPFYPLAGRLGADPDGRNEIHCTGEGAMFVAARSDRSIDEELGDFAPSPEMMRLVPPLSGPSYSPSILFLAQVTFFKCNGMTLGVVWQHRAMDGHSTMHFINHWCKVARGRIADLDVPPFLDRTVLCARSPPEPRPLLRHRIQPQLRLRHGCRASFHHRHPQTLTQASGSAQEQERTAVHVPGHHRPRVAVRLPRTRASVEPDDEGLFVRRRPHPAETCPPARLLRQCRLPNSRGRYVRGDRVEPDKSRRPQAAGCDRTRDGRVRQVGDRLHRAGREG